MKRTLSIALLLIYTTLTCGVALQLHYCGGKLASVDFLVADNTSSCACGSKSMKKGCCKDKKIHFQLKSEQKTSSVFAFTFNNAVKDFFHIPLVLQHHFNNSLLAVNGNILLHPPPLLTESVPPYLLHRVFRI